MKKRMITLALAILLVVSLAVPAMAAPITSPGTGTTSMTYTVTSSFSVTIPEGTIDLATAVSTGNIAVAAGKINHGQKITVTAASANPGSEPNKAFQIKNVQGLLLTYSVKQGTEEAGTQIYSGDVAAEFTAEQVNTGATQALAFKLTGTATYAGTYTDTITFTVAVA